MRLLYEIILFIACGILIRYLIPVQLFSEGPNFDEVIPLSSGSTSPVSISQDCINRNAFLIGLVDDHQPMGGHASQIYDLVRAKMEPEQSRLFKTRVFPQISSLEAY
mmetsp:Transcript_4736/g.7145  ORF Transcript_4736/g.7145 Transcript_4736/m.7145 type:complete len:107 (+) Transcript_4736:2-322(+)